MEACLLRISRVWMRCPTDRMVGGKCRMRIETRLTNSLDWGKKALEDFIGEQTTARGKTNPVVHSFHKPALDHFGDRRTAAINGLRSEFRCHVLQRNAARQAQSEKEWFFDCTFAANLG